MKRSWMIPVGLAGGIMALTACSPAKGNVGNMPSYQFSLVEAEWIRNGEPAEFEGEQWYPQDSVDILLDAEVMPVGNYRGTQLFIDRVDVRPYEKIYTKFGKDTFRVFRRKIPHDQG